MTGFAERGIFLAMWLGYLSMMILAIGAVLLWAVRSGQLARNYPDCSLLRAMLTGVGHEPVLDRVVPPRLRWYLVMYVQSLAGGSK